MAGTVEHAECIAAEGYEFPTSPNKYPKYDIKLSDGEAPVLEF